MFKYISIYTSIVCCLLLCFVFSKESTAQVNGTFEALTCPPTYSDWYFKDAFYNNCVTGWKASHGSADVVDYFGSRNAYLEEHDGIFSNYNFEEGHVYSMQFKSFLKYELTYAGITPEPEEVIIYVVACNNLVNANGAQPSPADFQVITTFSPSNMELWETHKAYNFIPKHNYSQVWLYWKYAISGKYEAIFLDNVSITNNCPSRSTINFQNKTFTGSTVTEGVIVRAGTNVSGGIPPLGAVQVSATANVQFWADQYIALENEFTVLEGAQFNADIRTQNACLTPTTIRESEVSEVQQVSENATDAFTVMPNPSTGPITLVFRNMGKNGDVTVIDSFGRPVHSQNMQGEQLEMDLSGLVSGVYTVKVVSDGKLHYRKIILQH